jgi:hypothetical protein
VPVCLLLPSTFVFQLVCCYRVLLYASLSATQYFCVPACLLTSTFLCASLSAATDYLCVPVCQLLPGSFVCHLDCCYRVLMVACFSAATYYFCVPAWLLLPSAVVCNLSAATYRVLLWSSLPAATEYFTFQLLACLLPSSAFVCQFVCCYRVLLFARLSATDYFCVAACLLPSTVCVTSHPLYLSRVACLCGLVICDHGKSMFFSILRFYPFKPTLCKETMVAGRVSLASLHKVSLNIKDWVILSLWNALYITILCWRLRIVNEIYNERKRKNCACMCDAHILWLCKGLEMGAWQGRPLAKSAY